MGTSYYVRRGVRVDTKVCALPVNVWSPLNETAHLSMYMDVYIYIYTYIAQL